MSTKQEIYDVKSQFEFFSPPRWVDGTDPYCEVEFLTRQRNPETGIIEAVTIKGVGLGRTQAALSAALKDVASQLVPWGKNT